MNASVLDKSGKAIPIQMGCYGIGITRLMAACIEQSHDDRGIMANTIAPFQLIIIQIDSQKSADVGTMSESMYATALNFGIETILDDRDRKTSPGVKLHESGTNWYSSSYCGVSENSRKELCRIYRSPDRRKV